MIDGGSPLQAVLTTLFFVFAFFFFLVNRFKSVILICLFSVLFSFFFFHLFLR